MDNLEIVFDSEEDILGYKLKSRQKDVLKHLLHGENVFAVLPTGYGKSVCYGIFGNVYDKIHPRKQGAITLVISPLRALIKDQVKYWSNVGVKAAAIEAKSEMKSETVKVIQEGDVQLLFASPEVLHHDIWWNTLKQLKDRINLLAVDEAHCLHKWGTSFRSEYLRVGELRSILTNAPVLALTATATTGLIQSITDNLGLRLSEVTVIAKLPDRPNIYLDVKKVPADSMEESFDWYLDLLLKEKEKAPKAIIYARTIDAVTQLFFFFMSNLQGNKDINLRLVEMFHGQTDEESQERILENFTDANGPLRCVIATIAFGLGVQVPDIDYVIHWGPSKDVLSYWQEVGRCARGGGPGTACLYIYPRSMDARCIGEDMLELVNSVLNTNMCVRAGILRKLHVPGMDMIVPTSEERCCCNC